jgi:hypothetical protein
MITTCFRTALLAATVVLLPTPLSAQPPEHGARHSDRSSGAPDSLNDSIKNRVSVAVARDRAKLMHSIYAATLDVMHERYFHRERAIVPARAMEDVFSEIQRQSHAEARWIAVNLKPMSVDHQPKTTFEKRAAKEIAAGNPEVEVVEKDYYRRAGAIPLTSNCISCHSGFFRNPDNQPQFAGLVISIPIRLDASRTE